MSAPPRPAVLTPPRAGFTLIELLGVLAILAVVAAVALPTLGAARTAAARARTKTQFAQWALACAQFRQEYGYAPILGTNGRLSTLEESAAFVRALTGRNVDGTEVSDPAELGGNTRRLRFLALAEADLRGGLLTDAFGNTEFGLLLDRNADGRIQPGIDGPVAAVASPGGAALAPSSEDIPPSGVRGEIILYSAGRGLSADDLVFSWK